MAFVSAFVSAYSFKTIPEDLKIITLPAPSFHPHQQMFALKLTDYLEVIGQKLWYWDYQLSKPWQKFGDQVLMFSLCCLHGQLASFPVTTCRPLILLAAKWAKGDDVILLPLETSKVVYGNTVILRPKLHCQSSVSPYSTDNRSIELVMTVNSVLSVSCLC